MTSISYAKILYQADEALQLAELRLDSNVGRGTLFCGTSGRASSSLESAIRWGEEARVLLELVEASHCGSVGGFAKGQTEGQRLNLKSRVDYLIGIYGAEK